jgi:aminodeoxyfutalosine synthase
MNLIDDFFTKQPATQFQHQEISLMSSPPSGFAALRPTDSTPQTLPPLPIDTAMISDTALVPVAHKLAAGQRLDLQDGLALMESHDIHALGHMAHAARLAKNGRLTHYVVNRHLNYSNICGTQCAFCAFWCDEGQDGAYLMDPSQPLDLAQGGDLMVDEVHIVGSCHPNLPLEYYEQLLKRAAQTWPNATIKAFTAVEIAHMTDQSGLSAGEVLDRLTAAGLEAMTGGGAEVFSPRVRTQLCPEKISGERWLQISGIAHERGIPSNATMLYGHIETARERVEHLLALREQQDKTGGFNAFIPLSFHPQNTQLSHLSQASGLDDLRVVSVSRLLLDNFPHIKAYWVMLGMKIAELAQHFGADDLDGTILEERITHTAGAATAKGITEKELRQMIRAAGFVPLRRDGFYNCLNGAELKDSGEV